MKKATKDVNSIYKMTCFFLVLYIYIAHAMSMSALTFTYL